MKKKRLRLKKVEIDEEKIDKIVEKTAKEIEKCENTARLATWNIGKLIERDIRDLDDYEKDYYFKRMKDLTGLDRHYLMQNRLFYLKFPNLPEIVKKTRLPLRWLYWLSMHEWQRSNVRRLISTTQRQQFKNFKEFKEWCKTELGIRGRWIPIPLCETCGCELFWDEKGETWRAHIICDTCWNIIIKDRKILLDQLEEKEKQIKKLNDAVEGLNKEVHRAYKKLKESRGMKVKVGMS